MKSRTIIQLFHILFLAPLLMYIGIKQNKTPKQIFLLLLVIGISSFCYHLYRYIMTRHQVNLFHLVAVLPLLIYVGINKRNTPQFAFLLLFAVGVVALWYHINTLNIIDIKRSL